jgi:hypothetical protein
MYASLSDEGTLQQLVDDTKIPDLVPQLQEFALRPIAKLLKIQDEQLASSSSMQSPQLLQLLRAVRNLSAVGEDMTQNLYSNGILAQIINLLKTIVDISPGCHCDWITDLLWQCASTFSHIYIQYNLGCRELHWSPYCCQVDYTSLGQYDDQQSLYQHHCMGGNVPTPYFIGHKNTPR